MYEIGERGVYKTSELELIQPELQEPDPGKFYRTKDGDKLQYVGKAGEEWIYCYGNPTHPGIWRYSTPYMQFLSQASERDIVGEWVDEVVLPAMEIKRWAVISRKDSFIWKYYASLVEAEVGLSALKGAYEIVELTGTLPERKVTK